MVVGWFANLGAVFLGLSGIADRQKASQSRDKLFILGSLCFVLYSLPNALYISAICQSVQVLYFYKRYKAKYGWW